MENEKRLQLLSEAEISDLYDKPCFTPEERELYFTLNPVEQQSLGRYHNTRTRVYFILQLGYFKAKHQFFRFHFEAAAEDTNFILKDYFDREDTDWKGGLSRDSIRAQKRDILNLFNYRDWSTDFEPQILTKLGQLVRYFPKSHSALRQLLFHLDRQRIIIPSYRTLAGTIICAD